MVELPWIYAIFFFIFGIGIGVWFNKLNSGNMDTSSFERIEHDIDAMNEIEFLSPEDIAHKKKDTRLIPWQVVDYGINRVIRDMIKAKFEPEIIVGVGRGGGVVACLVAGNLGNKPVAIIDRRLHYRNGDIVSDFDKISHEILDAKKILLVIGGPSSGRAVLEVAQKISKEMKHASEIKTVNFFEKQPIAYAADFKYKTFKVGIRPPWQLKDEYKAFGGFD